MSVLSCVDVLFQYQLTIVSSKYKQVYFIKISGVSAAFSLA